MSRRQRDQHGLAAILVSLSMVALLVIASMILDFGMVRYQRQINKSTADAAVAAGMRSFDQNDGQIYAFKGVCDAIGYLKVNEPKLASIGAYAPCSSTPTLAKTCYPSDTSSFASYTSTTTDGRYTVSIQAPYTMPDPAFPEDALAGVATDNGTACQNLAVIITERYKPGLGGVVIKGKIGYTIRSVGRVANGPGTRSPALLLLDRHECLVLTTGTNTNSANQDNFIRVFGAQSGSASQPGTIHADSDGSACGSNETIFQGKRLDGIVAYANPNLSEAGIISSYARRLGVAQAIISDGLDRTYGSDRVDYASAATGTKYPVQPLGLITRKIVDDRYLEALRVKVSDANNFFNLMSSASAAQTQGFAVLNSCTGNNQTAINGLGAKVYVDCTQYKGEGTFNTQTDVFFRGTVEQQATTLMPKAERVWVRGSNSNAIDSTGNPFRMHYNGLSSCPTSTQNSNAYLYIYNGQIKNNNGWFQACNTAVIMMSGKSDACLPAAGATAPPTSRPCGTTSGDTGSGFLSLGGGGSGSTTIDWTAPNAHDADMTLMTEAQKQTAWNQLEDLAYWSESYGDGKFTMSGGSGLHLVGVFMTPNADPFTVTGGGAQTLTNAQYIATKFEVNGGASLNMVVDPNNTVTLPKITYFDLVR